jgi:hypothetical protein
MGRAVVYKVPDLQALSALLLKNEVPFDRWPAG